MFDELATPTHTHTYKYMVHLLLFIKNQSLIVSQSWLLIILAVLYVCVASRLMSV